MSMRSRDCATMGMGFAILAASASVGLAQPSVLMDFGLLQPGMSSQAIGIGSGNVGWYRFEVPEISRCQMTYLDIVTVPQASFDNEIGLYDAGGKRLFNDDDDGQAQSAAMSFGAISPERPLPGGGLPGNGRDGPLAPGVYYLAIGAFNTTFLDTNWDVIPDGEGNFGACDVQFILGAGDPVNDPPSEFWEGLCATDAGNLPGSAAAPVGTGAISTIHGVANSREDIDLYKICVTDAASFDANTMLSVQMDTQLYLFNAAGRGVSLNDDSDDGVQSRITSAVVAGLGNGEYYLAVTPSSCTPLDGSGNSLWDPSNSGERVADGPGGANPIGQWSNFVFNDNTWYIVSLTGASFCPTAPACGNSDFNGDGDFGTDADIEAFFACLAGSCCPTCFAGGADFNMDGDTGTDADIESFFRVLAGGAC